MDSLVDSPLWTEIAHRYNLDEYGQVQVGHHTKRFGFDVRVKDLLSQPSLVFGIAQAHAAEGDARFAVRIDLATGQIWDSAHDTGLIGILDTSAYPGREELRSLCLRWELERAGDALIPRLFLGGEEFLYPAVRFLEEARFVAFTGHDAFELEAEDLFNANRVWCVDRLGD